MRGVFLLGKEGRTTETRVAIIGIIVEDLESAAGINEILHEYSDVIIGRMGLPYRERNISVMSIAVDAAMDQINTMTGKIGKLHGVSAKAAYSKSERK